VKIKKKKKEEEEEGEEEKEEEEEEEKTEPAAPFFILNWRQYLVDPSQRLIGWLCGPLSSSYQHQMHQIEQDQCSTAPALKINDSFRIY